MAAFDRPARMLSSVSGTIVMNLHDGGATEIANLAAPCWSLYDVIP